MIGKWIQKIKKNKRQLGIGALAMLLVGVMGVNLLSNQAITTYALETQVEADAGTQDSWQGYKRNSTQYTGRIWTDKSVYKENVTLENLEGSQTQTIEKPDTSDFLVSLSALSSASTLVTTTTTPLDIVLVLDVSGSMSDEMTETRITYEEYRTSGNRANNVWDAWRDRGDLYYSANGQDYIKINMTQTGIWESRYTISAEGFVLLMILNNNSK